MTDIITLYPRHTKISSATQIIHFRLPVTHFEQKKTIYFVKKCKKSSLEKIIGNLKSSQNYINCYNSVIIANREFCAASTSLIL